MEKKLTDEQVHALRMLSKHENVLLTGRAGTGKSHVIRHFMKTQDPKTFAVLASTGVAAELIGGRTFNSFFGIGILSGGIDASVARALDPRRPVIDRMRATSGVVIDEISMISGDVLSAAERVARLARNDNRPWGGMRVIAVGDFGQLPPVDPRRATKDWAFLHPVWRFTNFKAVVLDRVMRSSEGHFLNILGKIREGIIDSDVVAFLNSRKVTLPEPFDGMRVFPTVKQVGNYNEQMLSTLPNELHTLRTVFDGSDKNINLYKKLCPVGEEIRLKVGALVMMRANDVDGRYVNGSLGTVREILPILSLLSIDLHSGENVLIGPCEWELLDASYTPRVVAKNYPVSLAWASTIHKTQGMTIDRIGLDLRCLWEPGQAYVALSRVRSAQDLCITDWTPGSIRVDPEVRQFHKAIASAKAMESS